MKPEILIITGLSGSGKTVALRAIEDSGYVCVDNLPPQLIESFASIVTEKGEVSKVAIGIDVREKDFLPSVVAEIHPIRDRYTVRILFLEAEKDVLLRRFKETRRPHPLVSPGEPDIQDAVSMEKELLISLRENADHIVDTSSFTPHQLRDHMISLFGRFTSRKGLGITLISFGFKFGVPKNIDLLFDVRFLPNPHFVPELKELTGMDIPVKEFVMESSESREFIDKLITMLNFLIPLYEKEGKSYLTVGIGCTGGRHRSPAITEHVSPLLNYTPENINIIHRDI